MQTRDYKPLVARYGVRSPIQDMDRAQRVPPGLLGIIHLVGEESR